jgi:nucleoside-diphosphate-sugar epimerase
MLRGARAVLITGATGFIGSSLTKLLIHGGYRVKAISSGVGQKKNLSDLSEVIDWYPDTDLAIKAAVSDISHFFNFSVVYDRPTFSTELINYVNLDLPVKILSEIIKLNHPVSCIFGDSFFRKYPINFTSQPRYTNSKNILYKSVQDISKNSDCKFAFLLIEQVYGPGDNLEKNFSKIINDIIYRKSNIPLTSCLQKRDFIYIDDLVSAIKVVAESNWSGLVNVGCGTGVSTPLHLVLKKIKNLADSNSNLDFGSLPHDQLIMDSFADNSLLYSNGWVPKFELDQGLSLLIDHIVGCKNK